MQKHVLERIARLRKLLKSNAHVAFLVSNPINVTYLTGFTGDASYLLVTGNDLVLVSDSRFTTQIEEECPGLKFEIKSDSGGTLKSAASLLKSLKITSLAIEAQSVSKAAFDDWQTLFIGVELVSTSGLVESLRAIKDPVELALIRKSIEINERVFQIMRDRLSGKQTEREIGHQLENDMRQFGASGVSFPPIVGVGPRSALPHATLTEQQVASSPFMLVDWGTRYQGYASDLTRIVITGKVPARFRKIYEVVRNAQQLAIHAIGPGVDCQHVDRIAREFIAKSGFGKYFGHGLGHSFGLQVHESPSFSPNRRGTLEAGMVVTVEPGIYLPGFGGVRIEDDILVTKNGFEILSSLPTDFESAHVTLFG